MITLPARTYRLDRLIYFPVLAAIAGIWYVSTSADIQARQNILQRAQNQLSLSVANLMDIDEMAAAAAGNSPDQENRNRLAAIWRALLSYPSASIWIEKYGVVVAGEAPVGSLAGYVVADEARGSSIGHAALPKADALAGWRRSVMIEDGVLAATSLGLLFLTYLLARSLRQRARAEQAMAEAMTHLLLRDRALEAISQGITIAEFGVSGNPIIYTNAAFAALTQCSADEIKGRKSHSFFEPAIGALIGSKVAAARGENKVWQMEAHLQRKDGTTFLDNMTGAVITNAKGAITHSVIVHTDVTEERRRDQQLRDLQKLESAGHLTGGIAHEFNNLLAVITTNAEDLHDHLQSEPDYAEQADMVLQAANRGAGLVKQLMVFSRKQELEPQVIDIDMQLRSFVSDLRQELPENVEIEVLLQPDLPRVYIDPEVLDTALLNIALNARDAMPDGGKIILEASIAVLDAEYVARHVDVEAGRYVLIAISDTGVGMPEGIAKHAFEPFFTTKEVGKGTGLGLSMVYGFVKKSGGHANLYSEPGLGTTVKIYLPPVAEATVTADEPSHAQWPAGAAVGNILLVEDDDLVRTSVGSKLDRLGYSVATASSADEAIMLLKESGSAFDLMFSDVIMPGSMTGADLACEVHARWPSVKILLTSGYTAAAVQGKVKMPPDVRLLSKPYSNAELEIAVRDALGAPRPALLVLAG